MVTETIATPRRSPIDLRPKFRRFLALAVREKIERLKVERDALDPESDESVGIDNDIPLYEMMLKELET